MHDPVSTCGRRVGRGRGLTKIKSGLDMFNHKTGKQIAMEGDEACASLVAEERFEAGEEVFINYGHKSNEELLFGYGFAIPQNPLDIVTIQLGCRGPPEIQRYRQKHRRKLVVTDNLIVIIKTVEV